MELQDKNFPKRDGDRSGPGWGTPGGRPGTNTKEKDGEKVGPGLKRAGWPA
jgi:hypothetical protein